MNQTQNTPPRRRLPIQLLAWLILTAVFAAGYFIVPQAWPYASQILFVFIAASLLLGLWWFIRWSCRPGNLGRALTGLAVLATLIAVFYLEEDWRGQRAWTACRTQIEAQGIVMDWNKYIPPAIPDDQNFFTASTNILIRFKKAQTPAEIAAAAAADQSPWLPFGKQNFTKLFPSFKTTTDQPLVIANITVVTSSAAEAGSALPLADPNTPGKVQAILRATLGRTTVGITVLALSELPLKNLTPTAITLKAETLPAMDELKRFLPEHLASDMHLCGRFEIRPQGAPDHYQIVLASLEISTAAEYLQWSDQFVPAFDEIREALKRPWAVLPGDYSRPELIPIPNFVLLRSLSQTLAQRAQCDLLLGKPEAALHEITLVHDVCRILQKPPAGKPETLVEAMINVAINGLYTSAIKDGFRLQAWQEPQLAALQQQLQTVSLAPYVAEAFRSEVAANARTLETSTPAELQKWLFNQDAPSLWQRLSDANFWVLHAAPRGWYYQNMAVAARLLAMNVRGFDLPNDLILPSATTTNQASIEQTLRHWSLWNRWASIAIPNFLKATQITAYNQTLVNEAQIACALERYRLARGEYPATLDALMPQYMAALPHDVIGGQPLHYRRLDAPATAAAGTGAGPRQYLLYSVGWNQTDDGGQPGTFEEAAKGDWVWSD